MVNQVPDKLYHATYNYYLPKIKEFGLDTRNSDKMWSDSKPGIVYLSDDPYVAESYAEISEMVSDEVYDSGIVILEISTKDIDVNRLEKDSNVRMEDSHTYEYHGEIPWENINIFGSINEKDEYW